MASQLTAADDRPARVLFVTLQHIESDFYGRVGQHLRSLGHEVAHVTFSRRAARVLERMGMTAYCLPDLMAEIPATVVDEAEAGRIAETYATPTFRDVYRTDFVCDRKPEAFAVTRTVRHVLALEKVFDEWSPTMLVPEVGNETMRIASHLIALDRGIPTLFLFHTIFPKPLRLYVDSMHRPIVRPDEVQPLTPTQRAEVDRFIEEFLSRDEPIRAYRSSALNRYRVRMLFRHVAVKLLWDRRNDYLRPMHWALGLLRERVRARAAERFYDTPDPSRPWVYFPLHVNDDYKLKHVIPHCADQVSIVGQVARSLPHGVDLVLKEHPLSIGRTPLSMLRRLRAMRNVRIVHPRTSSHDLIRRSRGVVVISSTVGVEALLHGKAVLTMGHPFYSQLGVTLDLDGTSGLRERLPDLFDYRPDPVRVREVLYAAMQQCYPGSPVLVDRSDENARTLANSLATLAATIPADRAKREGVAPLRVVGTGH